MRTAFLIPTKNRHGSLARTLRLLRRAALPDDEILLCDQSPTAFTTEGAGGDGVRVLHRPDLKGLPAARNALLAATGAEVACFLDDDTDLAPDFGARLRELATREPAVLGWGPVVEARPRRTRRLHRLAQLGVFHDPRRLLGGPCDLPTRALFGCCFAVRTAPARRVGFDARRPGYALGEDLDFFLRLGGTLRFSRALRAVHRRDGGDRADPEARGRAKARLLLWLAHRHGGGNPATPLHLALALGAAASGRGEEPGGLAGLLEGLARGLHAGS
jgi:glycosyltransferase involved in cell wall biosynthesis